jgi:mono/diheme cytochrome c family protein
MKKAVVLATLFSAGVIAALALALEVEKAAGVPPEVQKVFKSHCIRCHTGTTPPKGLSLMPDRAGSVVGAPSAEAPDLLLVNPDDPGASYLLKKVRGDEGISGKRMPIGGHLTPEELKVLEDWAAGLKK